MNTLQKWLIVVAIWIAAIGILLSAFKGRYRFAVIDNPVYKGGRFDTWTGNIEVKNYDAPKIQWEGYTPNLVKDIK